MSRTPYPGRRLYQAHVDVDGAQRRVRICGACDIETLADLCDACGRSTRPLFGRYGDDDDAPDDQITDATRMATPDTKDGLEGATEDQP